MTVTQIPTQHNQTPPHDNDAERAVLGSCLLDERATNEITQRLNPNDYYRPAHETIYHAIIHLYSRGTRPDPITVADYLRDTGNLTRVGGHAYLHDLVASVATTANATYYADIVAEASVRRRLHAAHTRAAERALTPHDTTPDTLIHEALADIEALRHTVPGVDPTTPTTTWTPIDLATIITGDLTTPTATLITRRDGKHLLYPNAVHSVSGEPGSGKSWLAIIGVAQELHHGNTVVYIDFEDRAQTIVARLLALDTTTDAILNHLRYIRPHEPLTAATKATLMATTAHATLVVIDGITEAMTTHGLSLMDNEDVAKWLALIPHPIADAGPAVLQIDHVVKTADNRGRYAIGGQHKLAGITGAAYKMVGTKPFGKGLHGHAKLIVDKDRHGDIGATGTTIADVHIDSSQPGPMLAWLDIPELAPRDEETGEFRPTYLMERISRMVEINPGMTKNTIKSSVEGKREYKDRAISRLITEGYLAITEGPNRSHFFTSITPFREDDNEA